MSGLTDTEREVLTAACDTIVPSIPCTPDDDGFFARKASDLWVPQVIDYLLAGLPEDQRASLITLLEALASRDFLNASTRFREGILHELSLSGGDAPGAIDALRSLTVSLFYGLPDEHGQNPNWSTLGYPGPMTLRPGGEKLLVPYAPDGDTTLEADVCIVGSGAGGGVIAGVLSEQGLSVVVLEAGGYFAEPDFDQLEIAAYRNLYWRGGPTLTADGNVSLLAGCCLAAGRWSTGPTRFVPPRECGSSGSGSSGWRDWRDRRSTSIWTRSGSD